MLLAISSLGQNSLSKVTFYSKFNFELVFKKMTDTYKEGEKYSVNQEKKDNFHAWVCSARVFPKS